MLMLIEVTPLGDNKKLNFNTSHVNVNPNTTSIRGLCLSDFNTSHVNVNLKLNKEHQQTILFQYISC